MSRLSAQIGELARRLVNQWIDSPQLKKVINTYLSTPANPPPPPSSYTTNPHPSQHFNYHRDLFNPVQYIRTLCNENVDVQDVKNGNQKWIYFLSSSALTLQIPSVEGKRIRCVRQKRSIKWNIELPVAIHEVRDGQRSRCLSSFDTKMQCVTGER